MTLAEFRIGHTFWSETGAWICTDIGTRVVVAIKANTQDRSWQNGPPYALAEVVFDEDDIEACYRSEAERRAESSAV